MSPEPDARPRRIYTPNMSSSQESLFAAKPAAVASSVESEDWIVAYCDGGSRGNPGPAGFGVHIQDSSGKVLAEISEPVGRETNNFAEYSGLLAALGYARQNRYSRLRVISDSELMVQQMKGRYKVKSPKLRPLYEKARGLAGELAGFEIRHVLREKNRRADQLANLAMDRISKKH